MELIINGKKAIDVFEGDLRFFCEILDESGYSVKHDDKYEFLCEDLRTSFERHCRRKKMFWSHPVCLG